MALDLPPLPDLDTVIESLGYGPARRAVRREVRALAAASVGVSVSRAAPLARGLLVRWVTTGKAIPGAERVPPKPVGFTEEVLLAARSSPTGRIGDAYVMISHAWRQLSERGSPPLSGPLQARARHGASPARALPQGRRHAAALRSLRPRRVRSSLSGLALSPHPHLTGTAMQPVDSDIDDPRLAAFCSRRLPELFHGIEHTADVWRRDPFDVPGIHANARTVFGRIVEQALASDRTTGRILLLQGEPGAGQDPPHARVSQCRAPRRYRAVRVNADDVVISKL